MNKICLLLLVICSISYISAEIVTFKDDCYETRNGNVRIFESKIRKAVESLRNMLKNGVPKNSIPALDPLDVEDYELLVVHDLLTLESILTAKSEGISNFVLDNLRLSLFLNLDFTVRFPLIVGNATYDLNATFPVLHEIPEIYGQGDFSTEIKDLVVKGKGKIGTYFLGGKLVPKIKKLELDIALGNIYFNVTGLFNDEGKSQEISESVSENLPTWFKQYKTEINNVLNKALPYINKLIAKYYKYTKMAPIASSKCKITNY